MKIFQIRLKSHRGKHLRFKASSIKIAIWRFNFSVGITRIWTLVQNFKHLTLECRPKKFTMSRFHQFYGPSWPTLLGRIHLAEFNWHNSPGRIQLAEFKWKCAVFCIMYIYMCQSNLRGCQYIDLYIVLYLVILCRSNASTESVSRTIYRSRYLVASLQMDISATDRRLLVSPPKDIDIHNLECWEPAFTPNITRLVRVGIEPRPAACQADVLISRIPCL